MKKVIIERVFEEINNSNEGITAKEIAQKTNFCMATVYKAVRELSMDNRIREDIKGRTSVYYPQQNAPQNRDNIAQNMHNKVVIRPQQTQQIEPVITQGITGKINEIGYDMEDYMVEIDSDYQHREFDGIEDFELLDRAKKNRQNVLLIGPKGSGKTYMIKNWCGDRGHPYTRINMDGAITTEDFTGSWVRVGNEWCWCDGLLTKFMRKGGVIVIDEINASPPEMMFVLHAVLDDGRQVVLRSKDGEVVKAHKDFMLIACMNPNYLGTQDLNEALEDRFDLVLYVDYDEKLERKLVKNLKIIDFAKRVRFMYNERKLNKTISTRALIQFENNMRIYGETIARQVLMNKFDDDDRQAIEEAFDMVFAKRNDNVVNEEVSDDVLHEE